MIESNRRVPLTEVRTDRLKIGEYTFILNDAVKEGNKVKEYKTELIGDGGTCLVYRSFVSNGDVKKKVILKEFYPLFNDVNYIPKIDRNIETGELLISEMHKQDDIFQKKLKRFEDSYYTFNELHNDETMNNNSINVMDIVKANNTIYMIIDYNNFMDLFEYMKDEISIYDFLHILQKTASAVGKLHKMEGGGYLHTDITPCNIAVVKEDMYVRLIDSDAMVKRTTIEKMVKQESASEDYEEEIIFSNSQGYSGPEMYMGVKSKIECLHECGPAADVFAIGALLYYYLYGQKISFTDNNGLVREKVINELQKFAYKKEIAEMIKKKYAYSSLHTIDLIDKFLERCLASNIYDRYQDMDEVVEALKKIKKLVEPQKVYIKENFHKNPNKVFGRDGKLKELTEKLQGDESADKENKNHLGCISAIGGMGKSTLAKLYAEENMDKYETIVEVWAENARRALININIINYPESDKIRFDALKDENSFAQWKNIVSERMCESKTLLIVHDYYMGEKGDFEIWHELPCDIILTSRDMYSDTSKTVNLSFGDLVSDDENAAIDMFKMYYYQNAVSKGNKIEIERLEKQVNDEEIRKLTEMLNYHPFAIKVIAKQMAKGKYTSEKMLEELKAEGLKAHNGAKFINDGVVDERDHDYGKIDAYGHIRQIFNITARAEMMSDEEKEILRYMILVPSVDGISVGRLIEWCELDEWETEGFLEELEEKGWLEKVEGGVDYLYQGDENKATVYRMPMVITEALKEQEGVMPTVDNTEKYIMKWRENEPDGSCNALKRMYIIDMSKEIGRYVQIENSVKCAELLGDVGRIIYEFLYKEGIRYLEKAEWIFDVQSEKYCEERALNLANLAQAYGGSNIEKALKKCMEAKKILEKKCDKKYAKAMMEIDGIMASIYHANGEYEKSIEINKQVLEEKLDKLGDNHIEVATIYTNLGAAYAGLKMFRESIECFEIAEKIAKMNKNDGQELLGTIYNNIANVCSLYENFDESIKYYKVAIDINERTLGLNYKTAVSFDGIGSVYASLKEYKNALFYKEKAMAIYENIYGKDDLNIAKTMNSIAVIYLKIGEYEKALEFHKKVHYIYRREFGENDDNTIVTYCNIGLCYWAMNDLEKAIEYYQYSADKMDKKADCKQEDVVTVYKNIAKLFLEKKEFEKVTKYCKKMEEYCKYSEGLINALISTYWEIGDLCYEMNEYCKAIQVYERLLLVYESTLEEIEMNMGVIYNRLAVVYYKLKKYDKAMKWCNKLLEDCSNIKNEDLYIIANCYSNKGSLCKKIGKIAEAVKNHMKSLEIWKTIKDENAICDLCCKVAEDYEIIKDYENALIYYNEALEVSKIVFGEYDEKTINIELSINKVNRKLY